MVAKTLGGSFKVITLAPRTVREMIQLPKETQKNGNRQTNQKALVVVAVHMETSNKRMHIIQEFICVYYRPTRHVFSSSLSQFGRTGCWAVGGDVCGVTWG